jgi:pimeloyl-ACP methyl ester carboxylesterase
MTEQVQFVTVNDAKIAYRILSTDKSKANLLFVHGYAMNGTGPAYRSILEQLSRDFVVYTIDLRGHGLSASETHNWSLANLADDVAGIARELGIVGAVYVGHSIGGFTGMYSEIRHPRTFSALCLINTACASGGGHAPPGSGDSLIEKGKDRAAMYENFAPMYVHATDGDVQLALDSVGLIDRQVHEAFFREYPNCIITAQIAKIEIPTLAINGLRDIVVPPAEQHLTSLGIRDCKEVNFSGEGHMLPLESASLAVREIVNFCLHDLPERGLLDRK